MITHEIIKVKTKVHKDPVTLDVKVGDWVYYTYAGASAKVTSAMCSVVVEMNLDNTKNRVFGESKPYLLMALTGTSETSRDPRYQFKTDPWVRWADGANLVKVTDEQKVELCDDFVSDYLETHLPQARRYLK